ncbi:MAG: dephospho-CoA kinase [Gemmatimonadota bacterium]
MLSIALTGNIAAGKSTVVELFRRWGATIIDADQLVREAQQPGTETMNAIIRRFGNTVLYPDGTLNRPVLREMVMADTLALADLNAIVHPAVWRGRERMMAQARERGDRIVISDIPLLFESADPDQFDAVILVDAPESTRRSRLETTRRMTTEAATHALAAQQASEPKRRRSDYVIDNDGTLEELEQQARIIWDALVQRAKGRGL